MTDTSRAAGGEAPAPSGGRQGPCEWYRSSGPPHGLRWLAEDFATGFAAAASGMLRGDVRAHLTAAAGASRMHFAQALEELTCSYVLTGAPRAPAEPPPPVVWLEFSPAAAFAAVECLLGAPAATAPAPQRPLTAAERRVLLRLADAVGVGLAAAWPAPPKPHLAAQLRALPLAAGEEAALVATFELTMGGRAGMLRLCLPAGLPQPTGPHEPSRTGRTPLELIASLEGVMVSEDELAGLAAGDIIATDVADDGEVVVRIAGIPKFAARLEAADGRKVLTVTRRLDGPAA